MGRLSPIPSLALDNEIWNYSSEFIDDDTAIGDDTPNSLLEDLAGTLADELTLQSDLFNQGSVSIHLQITITISLFLSTNPKGFSPSNQLIEDRSLEANIIDLRKIHSKTTFFSPSTFSEEISSLALSYYSLSFPRSSPPTSLLHVALENENLLNLQVEKHEKFSSRSKFLLVNASQPFIKKHFSLRLWHVRVVASFYIDHQ